MSSVPLFTLSVPCACTVPCLMYHSSYSVLCFCGSECLPVPTSLGRRARYLLRTPYSPRSSVPGTTDTHTRSCPPPYKYRYSLLMLVLIHAPPPCRIYTHSHTLPCHGAVLAPPKIIISRSHYLHQDPGGFFFPELFFSLSSPRHLHVLNTDKQ
jgi:hypothetical protein